MANQEFKVVVSKPGKAPVTVRISAADEMAARRVAEESGWLVEGVEAMPGPEPDATLNSLREEIRDVRNRLQAIEASPGVAKFGWNVFWAVMGALIVWTVGSWVLVGLLNR